MVENQQVTRDALQDLLLAAIYNASPETAALVFKGGTALRKVYGLDRYSDDLDFSLVANRLSVEPGSFVYGLRDKVVKILSPMYETRIIFHKGGSGQYTGKATVLGATGERAVIKIEIGAGKVYLEPMEKRIVLPNATYMVTVMDLNEMLAEKIRAVYTRRNLSDIPRDLFDIAFIIAKNGAFDYGLINKKLDEENHPAFSRGSFARRIGAISDSAWRDSLAAVLDHVPSRRDVIRSISAAMP